MKQTPTIVFVGALFCAVLQPPTVNSEILLADGFTGPAMDLIWTVANPGALYASAGALQVTDVDEAAPGPSGWHEGFIATELPIGARDFEFAIKFDFQSTTYQWLRVELLQADNSIAAVMARISDPSQYVLSQSGPTEVLNHPGPTSGEYEFVLSRKSGVLQFFWDGDSEGQAANTLDIARLRLSFGKWSSNEFGTVTVNSVFCQADDPCHDRLADVTCDGLVNITDVVSLVEVAFRGKPISEIVPCTSPPSASE